LQVTKLFTDLRVLLLSLVRRILKPAYITVNVEENFLSSEDFQLLEAALNNFEAYLPLNSVDYGASFAIHLGKINISPEILDEVKQRCITYLSVLCKQLIHRLPTNLHHYEAIKFLSPIECLKPIPHRAQFFELPLFLAGELTILPICHLFVVFVMLILIEFTDM